MKKILFLTSLFIVISCSESSQDNKDSKKDMDVAHVKSAMVDANNVFALTIFKEIIKNEQESKNVFISPLSIYYALSLAGTGADGETLEAFQKVLAQEGYDKQTMLDAIANLYSEIIPDNPLVTVEIANSLWPDIDFPVKADYVSNAKEYFYAEVSNLDFSNPSAVATLNNWIAEKTHDKIQNMITELDPMTVLVLINAIYFKGDWKYQFADSSNQNLNFATADGSTHEIVFMKQKEEFEYFQNDIFSSIKMPYVDSNYYMVAMLPNPTKSTNTIIEQLTNENWNNWLNSYNYEEVFITFPKFKFDFGTRDIKQELSDLGLGIAFSSQADFTSITDEKILIGQVLHKAFIEVNEKGSEAAAATVIEFVYTSIDEPQEKSFFANKPFLFAICEKQTNTIMFMGRVAFPEQTE